MSDPYLKGNKAGNRPHYYCFEDTSTGIYWMIPLSSRIDKYRRIMEKSATLNLRINPTLKSEAETVLSRLGIPMSTAVDMFLNQVVLVGGIPFSVTLPKAPADIDASQMTDAALHAKLQKGYDDYRAGRTENAAEAFKKFRETHR